VCSGIEAATVAWHPLGWKPVAFSEIEPFPSAVLAHHYPEVPNVGDMTKYKEWNLGAIDILVGGTPCQSFSVAGLRKGLEDPRGNLALVYCGILDHLRPKWFVWENVPGVLSSGGGRDFGSFLGALAELGYGFAYRVLDAQYFGVAQRRRRVFVVGYLGDWRPAAEVLFESQSLRRDPAPSRKAGKDITSSAGSGLVGGVDYENNAHGADDPTGPLLKGSPTGGGRPLPAIITMAHGQGGAEIATDRAPTLTCNHEAPIAFHPTQEPINSTEVCHSIGANSNATAAVAQPMPINTMVALRHEALGRGTGFGIGEAGDPAYTLTKGHSHAVAQPIPFDTTQITSPANYSKPQAGDPCHPLAAGAHAPAVAQPVSYSTKLHNTTSNNAGKIFEERTTCLDANSPPPALLTAMQVRRLTPVECERLQGFPDGYTQIAWRRSPEANCPDGPRYKALGNSMATPVMRWIGERIKQQESKP
jgi:DNA (cytosine-5)-methyltransferase 1